MKKLYFTIFALLFAMSIYGQVRITNTSNYLTADQMLLANEINESGEPFAEALGYNLDDLDPFTAYAPDSISYTLGINNYEYSRYQLGTIVSRSGMGLHMIWAPIIGQMAAMETDPNFDGSFTGSPNGYNEDDEIMKNIMHFGMLANQTPPQNAWPQFGEFIEGDPHLPQAVASNFTTDFSSLRWDRTQMVKQLNPAAMGQTLMKQYLWAQDMLGAFHDQNDEGIEPDGTNSPDSSGSPNFDPNNNIFYGGDNLDGFIGQVLTAEGINKVKFIISSLAYDGSTLGMVDPMTYNPANGLKYFPHKISVSEEMVSSTMPPKPVSFSVVDDKSYLWDQFSLIWGTLHFTDMMDPSNNSSSAHFAYHTVFDGNPFPAPMSQTGVPGPYDLMKGASMVIFQNIMAMHFNSTQGSFDDKAWLDNGQLVQSGIISTVNAGYIIVGLSSVIDEFTGMPLATMANDALVAQADFIMNSLHKGNGEYANSFDFNNGADDEPTEVISQAAAIRGLYAAYSVTNNVNYLNAANNAYAFFINNFYISGKHAFRTTLNEDVAVYSPRIIAIIAGALREASLVGGNSESPLIYTRFFLNVGNAMQLSEAAPTGETGSDSDGDGIPFIPEQPDRLPPVFASEATLALITGVTDLGEELPTKYELTQNYPNPFNPTTTINYAIARNEATKQTDELSVKLTIFDILGRKVATLVNKKQASGNYSVKFDASLLGSGIYFYTLRAGDFTSTRKMILMK